MNAELITNYLIKYEHLWWILDRFQHHVPYPCMDISMDLIDEKDYFGFEFDGDKSVYMLFFLGDSTNFPAICFPHDKEVRLDECPIYCLDSEVGEASNTGVNFKGYIKELLNFYLTYKQGKTLYDDEGIEIEIEDDIKEEVKQSEDECEGGVTIEDIKTAIEDLNVFSDTLIDYEYTLTLSGEREDENESENNSDKDSEMSVSDEVELRVSTITEYSEDSD